MACRERGTRRQLGKTKGKKGKKKKERREQKEEGGDRKGQQEAHKGGGKQEGRWNGSAQLPHKTGLKAAAQSRECGTDKCEARQNSPHGAVFHIQGMFSRAVAVAQAECHSLSPSVKKHLRAAAESLPLCLCISCTPTKAKCICKRCLEQCLQQRSLGPCSTQQNKDPQLSLPQRVSLTLGGFSGQPLRPPHPTGASPLPDSEAKATAQPLGDSVPV